MAGGLQAEVDRRTLEVMPLFGAKEQIRGFHPDAKKLVLEFMFNEEKVTFMKGAMVCGAQCEGQTVGRVTVAARQGLQHIHAHAFIDATGDGDLCAQAGARFSIGREGDGLVHAYSQSAGYIGIRNDRASTEYINFDAGFTDPSDAEDLTRARIAGIGQHRKGCCETDCQCPLRRRYPRRHRHSTEEYCSDPGGWKFPKKKQPNGQYGSGLPVAAVSDSGAAMP